MYIQLEFTPNIQSTTVGCAPARSSKSSGVKAACRMLVKLTHVFNFINILQAAFAPIFLGQKNLKPNCN
jgi:hypothetical protein